MIRAAVSRAAAVARLSAALLLCAAAGRFALSAVAETVQQKAPEMVPSAIVDRPIITADPPAPPPAPQLTGPTVERGKSIRIPIVVSVGEDRSEVRINGVEVGHSPYVGEVSCKAGESVNIELVPTRGPLRQFQRVCGPSAIRITED
ncbi:MAG: hypothetical protein R3B13_35660 [Polyangiaceae bacterium]